MCCYSVRRHLCYRWHSACSARGCCIGAPGRIVASMHVPGVPPHADCGPLSALARAYRTVTLSTSTPLKRRARLASSSSLSQSTWPAGCDPRTAPPRLAARSVATGGTHARRSQASQPNNGGISTLYRPPVYVSLFALAVVRRATNPCAAAHMTAPICSVALPPARSSAPCLHKGFLWPGRARLTSGPQLG